MNLRTTAYKNQLTEDDLLQVLHAAIKVEQFPEESRELRQHLFAAAFQYHRDDPMYKQPVYFGLSPKNCASVLRGLIVFYPSILFGPRCTSLDDYFSGSDGALERAALKHQYVREDKDGLIAAIIHSELYHFLHERFLSVYGAEEMEDGTHIETNLEILSLYFVRTSICTGIFFFIIRLFYSIVHFITITLH